MRRETSYRLTVARSAGAHHHNSCRLGSHTPRHSHQSYTLPCQTEHDRTAHKRTRRSCITCLQDTPPLCDYKHTKYCDSSQTLCVHCCSTHPQLQSRLLFWNNFNILLTPPPQKIVTNHIQRLAIWNQCWLHVWSKGTCSEPELCTNSCFRNDRPGGDSVAGRHTDWCSCDTGRTHSPQAPHTGMHRILEHIIHTHRHLKPIHTTQIMLM